MYATNFEQVGSNIQQKLETKGMNQQELADALGISKQVMSKIIKGAKAINVQEIAKIAQSLDTTVEAILTVSAPTKIADRMSFMGKIHDPQTAQKVKKIRRAIDEIHLLEELLNE